MIKAHPLHWPPTWPRTDFDKRERSRFGQKNARGWMEPVNHSKALAFLSSELNRLGASEIVISTNLELRLDGLPKAQRRRIDDVGVAVYFKLSGRDQCIPCDKWDRIADNIHAIGKTIEAIRGIERWGAKEMIDAAFRGFQALPDYSGIAPAVRYFDGLTESETRTKYKQLAKELHPDIGGDNNDFVEMSRQYKEAAEKWN